MHRCSKCFACLAADAHRVMRSLTRYERSIDEGWWYWWRWDETEKED
jgi:hypothetical protein